MYLPRSFENTDREQSLALMRAHPLATVISVDQNGSPFVSHLPLVVQPDGDGLVCIGHLSRANLHWKLLDGRRATAIFHGPDAYITPSWYVKNSVPTWNYAVVHVLGMVTLIEDRAGIVRCLEALTATVEKGPDAWQFWIPEELRNTLESAIVGFRLSVETVESKFKLSQNRSEADRAGVLRGLAGRDDAASKGLRALMQRYYAAPAE
ncbi:MAG TPA: FMN-binding negative transcriptional regulator [Vicinamibacterales bacterium]|nr:FMN-binding negative transcriptional regulator [Vicinamibacterales bacterium]